MFTTNTITLTQRERRELSRQARSRRGRVDAARRALVILLLTEGATWAAVCHAVGCSRGFIATWSHRFAAERVAGLYSRHRGQTPLRDTPQAEARILEATRRAPADGATHWEYPQTGGPPRGQPHAGSVGLGETWTQAASVGALYGLHRSGFRDKGCGLTPVVNSERHEVQPHAADC